MMYATCWSRQMHVHIGRFAAAHPSGPWQSLGAVQIKGLEGNDICAPCILHEAQDGQPLWRMFVQTECFREDGIIAEAISTDGIHFQAASMPVMTKDDIPSGGFPVVGLYDVALSRITQDGAEFDCMTFSAYRRLGCGDIYSSVRKRGLPDAPWSRPVLVMAQENVPFHNQPSSINYEWGLEGAKLVQLKQDLFLMVGVCFLDRDVSHQGTRQRVFFGASSSPFDICRAISMPLDPFTYEDGQGENGHPDTIDLGPAIGILYQERAGYNKPWHLRYTEISKNALCNMLQTPQPSKKSCTVLPEMQCV